MNYYLVSQRRTHKYEIPNHILWAPKETKGGIPYREMTNIRRGDIIFHAYAKAIHAVSIALGRAISANCPKGLPNKKAWNQSGWLVHLKTFPLYFKLDINELGDSKYNGFNSKGPRKGYIAQRYLTQLNKYSTKYFVNKLEDQTGIRNRVVVSNKQLTLKSLLNKKLTGRTINNTDQKHPSKPNHHKRIAQSSITTDQVNKSNETKAKNGRVGEFYLCRYLEHKYNSKDFKIIGESSIFCQYLYPRIHKNYPNLFKDIRPINKHGNDSYGCDYVVKDKANKKTYFYDAKATPNTPSETFYMSKHEADKWNKAKNSNGHYIYIIYRVYQMYTYDKKLPYALYKSSDINNGINGNRAAFTPMTYSVHPNKW